MDETLPALAELAAQRRAGLTVSCAELFTVGLLSRALASAGASREWFRGGVVGGDAAPVLELLDVPNRPMVEEATAAHLARQVARLFSSDVGMATVGVTADDGSSGRPVGTVVIGWSVHGSATAETLNFQGDPHSLRLKGTRAALARLASALSEH